ncbi:alpha/beta hydrolase [Clostridium oryzae]|nr:alpha/beta hydrolase-fold protein [Clostridium oryzae]
MKGTIKNIIITGYKCILYLPENYDSSNTCYPVVYINGDDGVEQVISDIESHFNTDCEEFIAVSIQSLNWNRDYSPWPAPRLSKKSDDFEGEALTYIETLVSSIKPFIDKNYRTKVEPQNTALIGYSLAGLATLYTAYITGIFGKIGCLSGSLWYDKWIEFIEKHKLVNRDLKIYMSLGKNEEFVRNSRMAKVGQYTKRTAEILKEQLVCNENLLLEWNEGGHFSDVPQRFAKALLWIQNI